ncbi:TetR/AcrR family transcriptional regulator [Planomicrobium sp. CPCC 101110]|uniref:TetR/AcrR family transcriptional regulator n=1 Tax=Planomicrobium sp. CPCC 101110 TaxID=2599619 RepID=UPI0011B85C47|nr:TetR/AcrR family transcriptional regulator [Planomicrobium sp. CPCC 101110]TWT24087.1 TetR/AcrR family transcriptional regulator [Planomicrobium sp. CPCC 101110]
MNLKKQKIIDAAYSLFINKGYISSSIQDILDEAGVSKGTFYNYFSSKSECLIAIMESIGSEIRQKRMAAAVGKEASDPEVLAEQLCIRIQLNQEKNLFTLYESIFYSQEEELKLFSRQTYVAELEWISLRIIDLFGEEAAPYALENAGMIHGSIQQLIHLWRLSSEEELPIEKLADFIIRRLKSTITKQMETGDRFIREHKLSTEAPAEAASLETLSVQLKEQAETLDEEEADAKQLVIFLSEELGSGKPRKIVCESVLATLANFPAHEKTLVVLLEQAWKQLQKR